MHPGWARSLSGPVTLLSSLSAPCPPPPPSLATPAARRPLGKSLSQAPTDPWLLTQPLLGPPTSLLSCAPSSVHHCPQTLLPPSPTFQPWQVDGLLLRPEGLSPPAQQQCKGRGPVDVPATSGVRTQSCPQPRTPSLVSDPGFTWPLPATADLCPCLPAPFGLEAFPKQRACAHLTDRTPEAGWRTRLVRSGASGPRHPIESGQTRVSLTVSP